MTVSIIIVNYRTIKLLEECIESIYSNIRFIEYEIIVVDNASLDQSCKIIKENFPEVILIESKINLGFGRANNLGIKESKGEYIFLLNSDTLLLNNVCKILIDYMEKNKLIAVTGGDLFNKDMTKQVSYGNFPKLKQVFYEEFSLNKIFKNYYEKKLSIGKKNIDESIKEVNYVCGANMMIRKSVLEEVGYFDSDFFLYYEETELSYRIYKKKYKSFLVPEAKTIHLCGESSGKLLPVEKFKIQQKSKLLFFKKTTTKNNLLCIYLILRISYLLKFLIKRDYIYKEYSEITKILYKEIF